MSVRKKSTKDTNRSEMVQWGFNLDPLKGTGQYYT